MKKSNVFILLLISLLLIIPFEVKATSNLDGWAYSVDPVLRMNLYDCTSSTNCTKNITLSTYSQKNSTTGLYNYIHSAQNLTFSGQNGTGYLATFYVNTALAKNYVYTANIYVCASNSNYFQSNVAGYSGTAFSEVYALEHPVKDIFRTTIELSNKPFDTKNAYGKCFASSTVFVPSVSSSYYGIRFISKNAVDYTNLEYVGFEIQENGQYTGDVAQEIKDYIDNADFGSATDVTELKESVNSLTEQIEESNKIQQDTNDIAKDTNDYLKDDDTTGATNEASDFFSGFDDNTHGLTAIITTPLNLIGSITSSQCSPLGLQVPFLESNNTLRLPCLSSIYNEYFGSALSIYQTVTFGLISYWVCVNVLNMVKGFKDPDKDQIEVMDL